LSDLNNVGLIVKQATMITRIAAAAGQQINKFRLKNATDIKLYN